MINSRNLGVLIVSDTLISWLRLTGLITELYDVQVLLGVQQSTTVGFQSEEIQRLITLEAANARTDL